MIYLLVIYIAVMFVLCLLVGEKGDPNRPE